jgi:hypothetical protein
MIHNPFYRFTIFILPRKAICCKIFADDLAGRTPFEKEAASASLQENSDE